MIDSNDSWDTYSKLVLQQLETLANGIEALRSELRSIDTAARGDLQAVKEQLTELKAKEDRVQDIKAWKDKIDDVASPPQIKTALQEIEELKEFKTRSMTIFMVVQFVMAAAIAASKMI